MVWFTFTAVCTVRMPWSTGTASLDGWFDLVVREVPDCMRAGYRARTAAAPARRTGRRGGAHGPPTDGPRAPDASTAARMSYAACAPTAMPNPRAA